MLSLAVVEYSVSGGYGYLRITRRDGLVRLVSRCVFVECLA